MKNLAFHSEMKDDSIANSHYLTYTNSLGIMNFLNLEVKRLR